MFSMIIALLALVVPTEILQFSLMELAEKIGSSVVAGGLTVGGTVLKVTSLCLQLACIMQNGKKLLTSHLDTLETELRLVNTVYEVKKRVIEEAVTGRMK